MPTSSVALAVNEIVRDKNKVFLVSGGATSDLTGAKCTPNTIHWTYDTWALANGTGQAIVKTGGDTWFFLTANYAFGLALERDTAAVVVKNGGKVLGRVRHPFPATDFSSFLLQAQASKAKIIGLANAGADTIKQASEFGIVRGGQKLAALLAFITDVHALGLQTSQGLIMTEAWYWDLNDANREFAKKFAPQNKGIYPTMVHALRFPFGGGKIRTGRRRGGVGIPDLGASGGIKCCRGIAHAPAHDVLSNKATKDIAETHSNPNLAYAVKLVHATCCLAGSASYLDDIRRSA